MSILNWNFWRLQIQTRYVTYWIHFKLFEIICNFSQILHSNKHTVRITRINNEGKQITKFYIHEWFIVIKIIQKNSLKIAYLFTWLELNRFLSRNKFLKSGGKLNLTWFLWIVITFPKFLADCSLQIFLKFLSNFSFRCFSFWLTLNVKCYVIIRWRQIPIISKTARF